MRETIADFTTGLYGKNHKEESIRNISWRVLFCIYIDSIHTFAKKTFLFVMEMLLFAKNQESLICETSLYKKRYIFAADKPITHIIKNTTMKKSIFMLSIMTVLLGACTNDDEIGQNTETEENEDVAHVCTKVTEQNLTLSCTISGDILSVVDFSTKIQNGTEEKMDTLSSSGESKIGITISKFPASCSCGCIFSVKKDAKIDPDHLYQLSIKEYVSAMAHYAYGYYSNYSFGFWSDGPNVLKETFLIQGKGLEDYVNQKNSNFSDINFSIGNDGYCIITMVY